MKSLKKAFLFILVFYLIIGIIWVSKDIYRHYQLINGLPILGYHGIVSDKDKKDIYKNNIYYTSVSEFELQMSYLANNNYHTLTMDEINDYYINHTILDKNSVALTFDDGLINFNTVVKPILEKYNLKATCFVIGAKTKTNNPNYLKQKDLINDNLVEYYSHSYDLHHNSSSSEVKLLETLSTQEIIDDLNKNKNIVSNNYFAFPYGRSSNNANIALSKLNVTLAFGYNQNHNMTYNDDRYLLPRYLIFSNMPLAYFKWIVQ